MEAKRDLRLQRPQVNLTGRFKMKQNVGNFKTNKVGTIASVSLKGACGEFTGFLVRLENKCYEIWDESTLVMLPRRFGKTHPEK